MVQGLRQHASNKGLLEDSIVQSSRLLALLTVADLVLRRTSNAVRGLRLSEENPLLRGLNDISPRETILLNLLIVGAVLSCLLLSVHLVRRPGTALRVLGICGLVAAIWAVVWRIQGRPDRDLPPALALPVFVAATTALGFWGAAALPALLGAILGSTWIVLADFDVSEIDFVEQAAEVLLAAGVFAAWPLAGPRLGRAGRKGFVVALLAAALIAYACWLNPPAWRHVVVHVFKLHTAGLPTPLLAALLALAFASLVGLAFSGRTGRGLSLGLLLLLASARGPEPELVVLRIAAALTIAWTWAENTVPGQNFSRDDEPQ